MDNPVITTLVNILSQPVVITAIAGLILGGIGKTNLQKIPFFGVIVKILANVVDSIEANANTAMAKAAVDKQIAVDITAQQLVLAHEQLKSQDKMTSAQAAINVSSALAKRFELGPTAARLATEAAVARLNNLDQVTPSKPLDR